MQCRGPAGGPGLLAEADLTVDVPRRRARALEESVKTGLEEAEVAGDDP